jgi:hypothetical protein
MKIESRDDRGRRSRVNLRTTDEKECIDQKGGSKLAKRIQYLQPFAINVPPINSGRRCAANWPVIVLSLRLLTSSDRIDG